MRVIIAGGLLLALAAPSGALKSAEPDYARYAKVLKKFAYRCRRRGVTLRCVNYRGLRASAEWRRVVQEFATFDSRKLKTRHERLAFYINGYNVLAIQVILKHYPKSSIMKIPGVWKKPAGRIAGRIYSLDGLEKGVVKRYGDVRFHFALVCAAVSCPDLRWEPYTAARLSRQLGSQTYLFLRNRGKGLQYNAGSKTVRLSKLFEWYNAEFKRYGGVMRFIRRYRKDLPGNAKTGRSLNYDWGLNGR